MNLRLSTQQVISNLPCLHTATMQVGSNQLRQQHVNVLITIHESTIHSDVMTFSTQEVTISTQEVHA